MAVYVFSNTRVFLDGHDVSGDSNKFETAHTGEPLDVSTFGGTWRKRIGGVSGWTFSLDGYLNVGLPTLFTDTLSSSDPWTTVTDSGSGFTADMVGQTLHIDGGANATPGDYTIISFTDTSNVVVSSAIGSGGAVSSGSGYVRGWKDLEDLPNTTGHEIMVLPAGLDDGTVAIFGQVAFAELNFGGAWGEAGPFSLKGDGDNEMIKGFLIEEESINANVTNEESATVTISGGVTAGNALYAQLHVLNITGDSTPTIDVVIESYTAAWEARITFDQMTARGSQFKSSATVDADTQFHADVTTTGTGDLDIRYAVAIGIGPT